MSLGVDSSDRSVAMAQHRHQRHDPRASCDEEQWTAKRNVPDEISADRTPQLELISGVELF